LRYFRFHEENVRLSIKIVLSISIIVTIALLSAIILSKKLLQNSNAQTTCDLDVYPGAKKIYGDDVAPGSTVCVHEGTYHNTMNKLQFLNFVGNENQPIRIINKDGQVVVDVGGPLYITSSRYVILDGSGDENTTYGFKVVDSYGVGLAFTQQKNTSGSIGYEISHIEAHHVEILYDTDDGNHAVGAHNDDGSGPIVDISLHDFYIHRTRRIPAENSGTYTEGFYIGSSFYNSNSQNVATLSGVKIYNNIIEESGWDGIQVGSASGGCDIYNNTIIRDSREFISSQHSGVMVNPGSKCNVYNNTIIDSYGCGIYLQGIGNGHIYNNVIKLSESITPDPHVNTGRTQLDPSVDETRRGICLGRQNDKKNNDLKQPYYVYNNTIISHTSIDQKNGSNVYAVNINDNNIEYYDIYNNLVIDSLHGIDKSANTAHVFNNYSGSNSNMHFLDFTNEDYHLTEQSTVAINQGVSVEGYRATKDIEGQERGVLPDIGAYEFDDDSEVPTPPSEELEFEAEDMQLSGAMTAVSDQSASAGSYIQTSTRDSGSASFLFTISEPGVYRIEGKVIAINSGSDSFFISIDEQPQENSIWDLFYEIPNDLRNQNWAWDDVTQRGNGTFDAPQFDPAQFNLSEGTHTLYIFGREPNTKLDRIRIFNVNEIYDLNTDGVVDGLDIKQEISRWNGLDYAKGDFNDDGVVNMLDSARVIYILLNP